MTYAIQCAIVAGNGDVSLCGYYGLGVMMPLRVLFFFEKVCHILSEATMGFDHVGHEGEDEELEADNESSQGSDEIVAIGSDLEILSVIDEKDKKKACRYTHENKSRNTEKFHGAHIADGFEDDTETIIDETVHTLDDFRFAIGKIGDMHWYPEYTKVFSNGINNSFLSVRKSSRIVETKQSLTVVCAEATRQICCVDIEE